MTRPFACLIALLLATSQAGCASTEPEQLGRQTVRGPERQTRGSGDSNGRVRVRPRPPRVAAPRQAPLSPKLSRPAAELVVAIGDLHGDLAAARQALSLAGAIDATDHWVGGELVVVQTGDVLDRGDDDRAVLDLLERLRVEAEQVGGQLIMLAGNHEIMNVQLNFSYVTSGGHTAFAVDGGRAAWFQPGGGYARLLAERPLLIKVGDTVFVHGGVLPSHVLYGLDRMNDEVRSWMLGLGPLPSIMLAGDGLVWTRLYSATNVAADCDQLEETLAMLGAKRMVVAHTPQLSGVSSDCNQRVWRIDVGMSRFYGGPVQVLEMRGDALRVLRAPDAAALSSPQ